VKKGISVSECNEREVLDIDSVSLCSCIRNLSPSSSLSLIQMTKMANQRKAEEELAPQLSDHKKRPQ